jgi:hypothetical protein
MELPIEFDPDFGGGTEEDLNPAWQEAARVNVNDDLKLRAGRVARFKELLAEKKIELQPGDERQLLGFLRAAMCDLEKAVEMAEEFVEFQTFFKDGIQTLNTFLPSADSKAVRRRPRKHFLTPPTHSPLSRHH